MSSLRIDAAPLVGRGEELKILSSAIDQAAKGAGKSIFLAGEGGVGKTRLAAAIAERAAGKGWSVAIGRAYPVETGVPYALFSDALMPVLRKLDPSALSVLSRGGAAELSYIFPALGAAGDRDRAAAGADPSEIKARVLWNFTQFLGRLSARQPLLIVLENLQWADASSLELLHFVARQMSPFRIFLLGNYNESERDSNPVLQSTEQSLVRLDALLVRRIGPLSAADVDEILKRMFDVEQGTTRNFSRLLFEWTRGKPFFVEETLKSLIDSGALTQTEGRWVGWQMEKFDLPSTIKDVVRFRLQRLSPN
ncbi:MAG TPA: AAA family ATPase, partial [Gemmatimonadaceae bacterium]|nr:AAA family ATPase [Gemmatimonadaceae bacterium]